MNQPEHGIRGISFDPSLTRFGTAVFYFDPVTGLRIERLFLIRTEKTKQRVIRVYSDHLRRAQEISKALRYLTRYRQQPIELVITEIPNGPSTYTAANAFGICLGVISSVALDWPLIEVTEDQVKIAATGNRHATKQEIMNWAIGKYPDAQWLVKKRKGKLSYTKDNEHLADAVACIHAAKETNLWRVMMLGKKMVSEPRHSPT